MVEPWKLFSNLPCKSLLLINHLLINLLPLPLANLFTRLFTCPQAKLTPDISIDISPNNFWILHSARVRPIRSQWLWNHGDWGLKFSGIGHFNFSIICGRWRSLQNLRGKQVNIQKYCMIWHGITLLLSLLLHYYYIYVNFWLYFGNKEKFYFCVWLQICSTYSNLIYCSFIALCDLILSVVLQSFPYWGYWGGAPTTSQSVAPPHHRKSIPPQAHTHTHILTLNNNFKVITQ